MHVRGMTWCAAFAIGCVASAQYSSRERVDAGFEDVNPFAVSTRVEPIELRSPSAFEHVYRSADGSGYRRISGAIVAEFFRSEYVRTEYGDSPVRPAGTVFYIGDREAPAPAAPVRESALRVDGRVSGRVATTESQPLSNRVEGRAPTARVATRPTVWTDEPYRQQRMASAIERAVRRRASR